MADAKYIRLALLGEFEEWRQRNELGVLKGLRAGADDVADFSKKTLRDALIDSGLKLNPKTWRADVFPEHGRLAWEPAVFVYSKAPNITAAFDEGGEIRAKDGYMAVPMPYYADQLPKQRGRFSKSKIELTYEKYGEDNLIVLPATADRPAILALKSGTITTTGKISKRQLLKSGKHGKKAGLIPLFWLVDSVELQQRIDIEKSFRDIERGAPDIQRDALARHLRMVE